jgi:DNA-binding transcriptional regulator YhcF (GntR family)
VEMKRGLGMFVKTGARDLLLKGERQKFLADEWPRVAATIQRLGLTQKELDAAATRGSSRNTGKKER